MMAKLTMADGCSVTIHNVALFSGDADITFAEAPDGGAGSVPRPRPDCCEYTLPRRSSLKLRYESRCEVELSTAEVLTLTDFKTIRDSHGSANVRVRSLVRKEGG
jgi:hypothetical protein